MFLMTNVGFATNEVSEQKSIAKASVFLAHAQLNSGIDGNLSIGDVSLFSVDNEKLAYVFQLKPQGFIIISAFSTKHPVIGFSYEDNFPEQDVLESLPVYDVVKGIALATKYDSREIIINEPSGKGITEQLYGPHVTTLWGQVNCHNNSGQLVNVTNYYTPNNYAAGCVAISLATMLHYYQWPLQGEGSHEYYDGSGSSTGTYSANFGNTTYDWSEMLHKYNNQSSTPEQRIAAGQLAFHAAVALEMNFEYNGSSSNVNRIPGTGLDYFRFYSFYKSESSSVFWARLDKNMTEANPVVLAVETNSGFGHSVVCDGLWLTDDEERFYHLNMGWWGSGNGWFTIHEDFNAGGYTSILGGILDFIPIPILNPAEISPDTNMFHLKWDYSQTIAADAYEVQRKINSGSWETIADDYADTSLLIVVDDLSNDLYFRVRAKVNDTWYPSSWSNSVQLDIVTGLKILENKQDVISVYPNPFQNNITLFSQDENALHTSIRIFNPTGTIFYVSDENIATEGTTISTHTWPQGFYFLEVKTENSRQVLKIVKK